MSMFALSEEHEALREAVRELATEKIAPRAAEIDRDAEFPWDVHEALVKADFHAVHVPEEYGGAGGDALASVLVIEEVARACAASSLTRAVRDGDTYVLNGVKRWITNAGVSKFYTVMAVTDPDKGPNGISAFVVEDGDPGFTFGAPEHKLGIKGSPTRELY